MKKSRIAIVFLLPFVKVRLFQILGCYLFYFVAASRCIAPLRQAQRDSQIPFSGVALN